MHCLAFRSRIDIHFAPWVNNNLKKYQRLNNARPDLSFVLVLKLVRSLKGMEVDAKKLISNY